MLRTAAPLAIALLSSLVVAACGDDGGGDDDTSRGAAGGGAGAGGAASGGSGTATCNTDYARLSSAEPVSLKGDLMPMFGLSCVYSQCHNERDEKAGLYLGVKCDYDADAEWKCTFPDTPAGPDLVKDSQPITQELVDRVHTSLLGAAATVPGGAVKRVVPGDPAASFLIQKLAGTHKEQSHTCENQDPSRSNEACGDNMPPGSEGLCFQKNTGQTKFDAFAAWVRQGALNN
ncbi:MAG: hypothetical protein FJ104_08005 [Deltaproteobacteria bacterium]|nr:hypothetical protein [Deltaproteobacteria bacterium]